MKLCPRCEEAFADDAGFCPFDGQALARSADPLLGRTLNARYRLVRRLGSGGMSVVYLARHVVIERRSAIKILRQDLAMNPAHRERFLREARAVNRINHPNIVQITDFGEDSGLTFLVMEYFDGGPLTLALGDGPMPPRRAVRIAAQIAAALGRAHELGVIHRDLKPDNVLIRTVDGDDVVKLTDFGIAKIVDAPSITFSEQRFGTPGYIAPEYVQGAPASASGDLYALGVLLYQLLTGELPYDARYAADLLVLQLREDPVKPSARVAGIPPGVEALVLQLMARDPAERPRDAYVAHAALEEAFVDLGGLAEAHRPSDAARAAAAHGAAHGEGAGARWRESLARLSRRIDDTARLRGEGEVRVRRARDLVEVAHSLVASLERAGATVEQHQARVDRLEADGVAFRDALGRAVDSVSRQRARVRANLEVITRRRGLVDGVDSPSDAGAIDDAYAHARASEDDMSLQIRELERQLETRNEELDADLADATARLEGVLSAVRRIARELAKTREDAERELG
jgi:serine/threonine-protein kinase